MAKYIKQEMPDLNASGKTQAYYRMQIYRNVGYDEFVDHCTMHGGMQRSAIVGVVAHVCHELSLLMAQGYSVTVDGLGTFRARLGVRPDKAQDAFEEGEPRRNADSIMVSGVSFRADKELTAAVDRSSSLVRGGTSRLRHSSFALDERLSMARSYLAEHHFMHVGDYARLTGLSAASASRELRAVSRDAASGIVGRGQRSGKVYVLSEG